MRLRDFSRTLILSLNLFLYCESKATTDGPLPIWEYGLGLGYIQYAHYPAANQNKDLLLPFPTFQYRGQILRADDRDGARAYIFKGEAWVLELSGNILPALESTDNNARQGMPSLPWMIGVGPQLVYPFTSSLDLKAALYQSVTTDFTDTRTKGLLAEFKLVHSWEQELNWDTPDSVQSFGHLDIMINAGNSDFLSIYFDVPQAYANQQRIYYESQPGWLSYGVSIFESLKSGRISYYVGAALTNYSISANRRSPLHKSDQNLTGYTGITYVLGESRKASVPDDETKGLINRLQFRGLWKENLQP